MDSFIEFYGKHHISPVRQDISDLERHFQRRKGLYYQLGLLPSFFTGKTILEIGPGSGYNSIVNASFSPAIYHMVDGNPRGIEDTQNLLSKFPQWNKNIEIYHSIIEDFKGDAIYDIVICEGMLTGQRNPVEVLKTVSRFVKPGGVLIITCIDPVSDLSENLRYLVGNLLIRECNSIKQAISVLLPVFSPHLEKLSGMSRRKDDWIVDNILNPAAIGTTLSINDAITAIDKEFDVYNSSPKIFCDWRWYKELYGDARRFSNIAKEQYWLLLHNLVDHTQVYGERNPALNRYLYSLCDSLRSLTVSFVINKDSKALPIIIETLQKLEEHLFDCCPDAAHAISEVCKLVAQNDLRTDDVIKCKYFERFFGRGQQHLSFVKNICDQ